MSLKAGLRWSWLLWGVSAGWVSLPADVAAQVATHSAPASLAVWIAEARSTPFHGVVAAATPGNQAVRSSIGTGVVVLSGRRPPMTAMPDSAVSGEKVFGYALVAAFVPMIPALVTSGEVGLVLWGLGGMAVTLVSVPIAAMAAGATSGLRAIAGTAIGFAAGVVFGGIAASGLGDYWFVPTYSVTMALGTAIAVVAR